MLEDADKSLHSAVDKAQVILLEIEAANERLRQSDPTAVEWMQRVEKLMMEQGELIFSARKILREAILLETAESVVRNEAQQLRHSHK